MTDRHEKQCDRILNELTELTALVARVKAGSEVAARELHNRLGHFSYEGAVIHIGVDEIINNVLDKESE